MSHDKREEAKLPERGRAIAYRSPDQDSQAEKDPVWCNATRAAFRGGAAGNHTYAYTHIS